eukprot:2052232-Lingulodinium_polyedra.AAC.1
MPRTAPGVIQPQITRYTSGEATLWPVPWSKRMAMAPYPRWRRCAATAPIPEKNLRKTRRRPRRARRRSDWINRFKNSAP